MEVGAMIPIDESIFDLLSKEMRSEDNSNERPFWDVCDADDLVVDPGRVWIAIVIAMVLVVIITAAFR